MTESERKDRMEDLHRQAGSKRFREEEPQRIDLAACCLILSSSFWEADKTTADRRHFRDRKHTRDISI